MDPNRKIPSFGMSQREFQQVTRENIVSAFESILNTKIFELMGLLNTDLEDLQAITFWFYSEEEGDIYRLAHRLTLKKCKVWISCCEYDNTWQCIAEIKPAPNPKQLVLIEQSMIDLVECLGVHYEGWLNCSCLEPVL